MRNEKINLNAVSPTFESTAIGARAKVRVLATGGASLLPERGQSWDFDSVCGARAALEGHNAEWTEAF